MSEDLDRATWERAAHLGQKLVRDHVGAKLIRRFERGCDAQLALPLLQGVVTETGRLLLVLMADLNPPEMMLALERDMMAFLRGGMRGAEWPINDDGTPYVVDDAPP